MIISAFSDTHGEPPPTIVGDVILHAGDVYESDSYDVGVKKWAALDKRILAVRGNHDGFDPAGFFDGREFTVAEIEEGLWVVGLGFATQDLSFGPYAVPAEHKMTQIVAEVLKESAALIPQGASVLLLSHYAPASMWHDPKEGFFFSCIVKACEALRPLVLLHGHIHQLAGRRYYVGETPVMGLGPRGFNFKVENGILTELES